MRDFTRCILFGVGAAVAACNGPGAARVPTNSTVNAWSAALPALANAGADTTALPGSVVCLNGAGSYHPLGQGYVLAWQQTAGETVDLKDADARAPCFVAPLDAQTLQFTLRVDDGAWVMDDAVNVVVSQSRDKTAPWVRAGADRFAGNDGATPIAADTWAADPNTQLVWEAAAFTTSPTSPVPRARSVVGLFRVWGVANDLASVPDYLLIWPHDGGLGDRTAPRAVVTQSRATALAGDTAMLDGSGSDGPSDDALRWRWTQTCGAFVLQGVSTHGATLTITAPRQPQRLCFRLTVHDSIFESAPIDTEIEVVPPAGESPFEAAPYPAFAVHANQPVVLMADPPGATFAWRQTVGENVLTDPPPTLATLPWTAPGTLGRLALTVQGVLPGSDGPIATSVIDVVDPSQNSAPRLTLCVENQEVAAGSLVRLFASAADAEQDPLAAEAWQVEPSGAAQITVETPGARPNACPPPAAQAAPPQLFQASLTAPASGTSFTVTFRICDGLGACGQASVDLRAP